ncbi:bifunctional aspartate kinase/homoserine dehydrogenase I [Aquimarina intermedia]|uniref:Aspartate kinase n=1 Tax=Aquimarina intermedia TaxID=350814 RepID=A0A5S5C9R8_9FLAO|nr:bifunctional aspartate kinase/homoserine dehydrogenase I [Aquimarina intermedia]TYP75909.1 aspartate kinase [Aquimarina intermedia]
MKILKFGGKSLANGEGINTVLSIIAEHALNKKRIAVVLSARGNATNELEKILDKAAKGYDYKNDWECFKIYQNIILDEELLEEDFQLLQKIFDGVQLLGDYSERIKDQVLSLGEVISAKTVTFLLKERAINANYTDSRLLIKTDARFGEAQPLDAISKSNVLQHFKQYNGTTVNVVTGFIASSVNNDTTTLGRNGSNYTASLLANYLDAEELQNYTHVSGIYTANPELVADAKQIDQLSFAEANELASFGTDILHAKTIIPLLNKNIPLRILNTFDRSNKGTLITASQNNTGIKTLSVIEDMTLINLEGRGLLHKVGVDARIFKVLAAENISVSLVSQGSSERSIGFAVKTNKAHQAATVLEKEFENDFYKRDVHKITVEKDVSVISIIGQQLSTFHKPYTALIKNQITPLLFSNTLAGSTVSLVVKSNELYKALNVMHSEVFGVAKKINLAIFGHGLVGGALINQILGSTKKIQKRKGISLNIIAIANSKKIVLDKHGIDENWKTRIENDGRSYSVTDVIEYAKKHHLANLIAIDNTASKIFTNHYAQLVCNGFDLVSSNKIANTLSFDSYRKLRQILEENQKQYQYETNVGAGLPLIDTIKLLHLSGENITRIKGVFSGSLSYLFNTYSSQDKSFSIVLQEAIDKGFTEPDPREDLSGNDVGRKLLILARELDLHNELDEVLIENLIPESLRGGEVKDFLSNLQILDAEFAQIKNVQKREHVLRYLGELHGDLSREKGILEVKLVSVPIQSALGQVKGSDSIFEIFTESYGDQPIVIQGAGAGASVTARGVFGDILRLAERG